MERKRLAAGRAEAKYPCNACGALYSNPDFPAMCGCQTGARRSLDPRKIGKPLQGHYAVPDELKLRRLEAEVAIIARQIETGRARSASFRITSLLVGLGVE